MEGSREFDAHLEAQNKQAEFDSLQETDSPLSVAVGLIVRQSDRQRVAFNC